MSVSSPFTNCSWRNCFSTRCTTEWTSFDHPDPTGEQLRCMQRQVLKMLEGSAADVAPSFTDMLYLPKGASVSRADWKRLLDAGHVYIWLDFFSVPQIGNCDERNDEVDGDDDFTKAINSIPVSSLPLPLLASTLVYIVPSERTRHRDRRPRLWCDVY